MVWHLNLGFRAMGRKFFHIGATLPISLKISTNSRESLLNSFDFVDTFCFVRGEGL